VPVRNPAPVRAVRNLASAAQQAKCRGRNDARGAHLDRLCDAVQRISQLGSPAEPLLAAGITTARRKRLLGLLEQRWITRGAGRAEVAEERGRETEAAAQRLGKRFDGQRTAAAAGRGDVLEEDKPRQLA